MIVFIFILFTIFIVAFVVAIQTEIDTKHNKEILNYLTNLCTDKPFSVSQYYDRIEKASLDIIAENEKRKDYKITLWIGFDGLQLNDDGSTQWIKRGQKKKENKPPQDFSPQNSLQNIQNVPPSQRTLNSIQNQINYLNTQNYHLLQMQSSLNQYMIKTIQQNNYLPYYPQMIYAQNLNQYCCNYSFYGYNNVNWL